MRKISLFGFLILSLALAACSGTPLNPGDGSAPADNQPTPAPVVDPGAQTAPETTNGGTTAGCLTVDAFASMWKASTASQGPGPLIEALNMAWDGAGGTIGSGWTSGPHTVSPMAIVWTDLLHNAPPAGSGKWVALRVQGQWGVFAAYDTVTVPTPGRSAKLCQSLDPAKDLAGW